jgi:hypothetical protein
MGARLGATWIVYNSGKYHTLEEKETDPFRALPTEEYCAARPELSELCGPWLGQPLEKGDLGNLNFTYPFRPDPKMLFRALKQVGLCTAGNTMGLSYEEVFEEEVKAAARTPNGWEKLQKDPVPPNWRFFLDSRLNFKPPFINVRYCY